MNLGLKIALRNYPVNYKKGGKKPCYTCGGKMYQAGGHAPGGQEESQTTYGQNQFGVNPWGLGLIGAYLGSQALLNNKEDKNYQAYKNRWIRDYSVPSLIQDPNKFSDQYSEQPIYQGGGLSREQDYGSKSHPYPSVGAGQFAGPHRSYPIPTHADAVDALRLAHLHGAESVIQKVYAKYPDLRKKLGGVMKEYATGGLPSWLYEARGRAIQQEARHGGNLEMAPYHNLPQDEYDQIAMEKGYHKMPDGTWMKDEDMKYKKGGKWIQGAIKHPGRCTPGSPNYDCPKGSPQWRLAQRFRHGDLHNSQEGGLAAANAEARRFALSRGLMTGENTHVNSIPQYIDSRTGRPSVPAPTRPLAYNVPRDIQLSDIQSSQGLFWYTDPHTGDTVDVDPSVVNLPRFKKSKEQVAKDLASRMKKGGNWIAGAVNPAHKGYCTPMSKSTCTPRRKAFARRAKAHFKQDGGMTLNSRGEQAQGYYGHPNASYLHFPGQGRRTFVPGPMPLMVMDDGGIQYLGNQPIQTHGPVTEMPIFKDGGEVRTTVKKVPRKDATIEAEKGELIFGAGHPGDIEDQNDRVGVGLFKIDGKKHYQGGTPLKAFPGDFVFSNDPKLAFNQDDAKDLTGDNITKQTLRTPAKLAKKYIDLNKFIDRAQNKETDPVTKKTAIYNVNNYIDRLGEIAYAQEEKKGFPSGIPAFAQASLQSRGYNQEALQAQLNQGRMRMGGEYQTGGNYPSTFRNYYDTRQKTQYSAPSWLTPEQFYSTPGLVDYMKTLDKIPGVDNDLQIADDSVWGYRHQAALEKFFPTGQPPLTQVPDYTRPQATMRDLSGPKGPGKEGSAELTNYTQYPNNQFNLSGAELYGLYAANRRFPSRYPTAYKNYEIQNAESLLSSAYSPISEQPYLNAIKRSSLGFEANNNPNGAAGYTRSLGAYNVSLGAENQAISQVYAQNQTRKDQQANALAQLEIQKGADRIQNQNLYDTKLETLAQNKEQAAKYRMANTAAQLNEMQRSREVKGLYNTMSDFYEYGPNNQMRLKPTYKIENGRLVPVQRSIADLIKGSGQTQNTQYISTLENVFKLMKQYGITNSSFIDDLMKKAIIPQ